MQTGQRLQTLRLQQNLTQEQLAEKLYVSRELVSKWELGQRRPNIRVLRDLSALFGVGIDELTDTGAFAAELASCIPHGQNVTASQLKEQLTPFLDTLNERDCGVFLRRYYYLEDSAEIAEACGIREGHVRAILSRTRKKLKQYMKGE
jgi:transcriptional regulator with XRE-family HTH domain